MLPGNRFTSKLKYTGDRNAASYQGDFRFACVQDRGCRGTVHFAERRAFRSLDTGAEGHGGVWSRWGGWGLHFCGGVLKACLPQAMVSEETEPQINADERRLVRQEGIS